MHPKSMFANRFGHNSPHVPQFILKKNEESYCHVEAHPTVCLAAPGDLLDVELSTKYWKSNISILPEYKKFWIREDRGTLLEARSKILTRNRGAHPLGPLPRPKTPKFETKSMKIIPQGSAAWAKPLRIPRLTPR